MKLLLDQYYLHEVMLSQLRKHFVVILMMEQKLLLDDNVFYCGVHKSEKVFSNYSNSSKIGDGAHEKKVTDCNSQASAAVLAKSLI